MTTTEQQPQEPEQSAGSQPRVDPELVRQLAQRAADEGVDLAGPGGLLQQMAKQVLETGLEVEMSEHLGYDKHEATGRDGENSRNGTRAKTVTTSGSDQSSSRCRVTGRVRSNRRPCASGNVDCTGSMRWCSR